MKRGESIPITRLLMRLGIMTDGNDQTKLANTAVKAASRLRDKRIFLLYASAGAGHRSACEAIKQAILDRYPDADVEIIDILRFMPRPIARLYSRGYVIVASKYPMLWYFIYESGSDLSRFRPTGFWHRVFWQTLLARLFEFLQNERPDYVVSSHFLSSWAAGLYKRKYADDCVVSTVVTDYGVHPVWISAGQDMVFVATEELRAELSVFVHYLGTNKIVPTGIPIHPDFNRRKDVEALKRKFQLDPDRYTLLVLGGMFGSKSIRDIILWLTQCRAPMQLILVAGRHYPIPERLKEKLIERDIKYQFYGYIDFMDELMAVSDLAITKAGALTTSECLASGLPLVIFKPYPGQEERNCDFFLEKGVAVRVEQLPGLSYKVDSILMDPDVLQSMKSCVRKIARPDSSERIVQMLFDSEA